MSQITEGKITIKLGNDAYRGNYLDDLTINETRINEMLAEQPARYVFWARMYSLQKIIVEKRKQDLEKYTGQLYTFIRHEKEEGGGKTTERQVETAMLRDSKLEELKTGLLRDRLKLDHLYVRVRACICLHRESDLCCQKDACRKTPDKSF